MHSRVPARMGLLQWAKLTTSWSTIIFSRLPARAGVVSAAKQDHCKYDHTMMQFLIVWSPDSLRLGLSESGPGVNNACFHTQLDYANGRWDRSQLIIFKAVACPNLINQVQGWIWPLFFEQEFFCSRSPVELPALPSKNPNELFWYSSSNVPKNTDAASQNSRTFVLVSI